jgi:hypothetical protein
MGMIRISRAIQEHGAAGSLFDQQPSNTTHFNGGHIIEDHGKKRVEVHFKLKPSPETHARMKSAQFKYNRLNNSYSRPMSGAARSHARKIVGLEKAIVLLQSVRYVIDPVACTISKAIALNTKTGFSQGTASYVSESPKPKLSLNLKPASPSRSARGIQSAASGVGASSTSYHVTSQNEQRGSQGTRSYQTHHHTFGTSNLADTSRNMRARLGGDYKFSNHENLNISGPDGISRAKAFTATHRKTGEQHRIVLHETGAMKSTAPKVTASPQKIRITKPSASPINITDAHVGPIHSTATAFGAKIHSTNVRPSKKNSAGPTDREYAHGFIHKNQQVAAHNMQAALSGSHTVTPVSQSRTRGQGGGLRNYYQFRATPIGGGPSHTMSFMRG